MSTTPTHQDIILAYWKSWQDADWDSLRAYLADEVIFGNHVMPAEAFVDICKAGNPWRNVQLLAASFDDKGGAILYEGEDTITGKVIRVGEFITLENGKVKTSIAAFGSGVPL